jgi:hypothetical protein
MDYGGLILIITTMRQGFDQQEIKQELSKFINLLQTDFRPAGPNTPPESRTTQEYPLQKRLSIIFSASEPESSSLDKENSNPSANRSFETGEKGSQCGSLQALIQSLLATNLDPTQHKLVEKLRTYLEELRLENERLSSQVGELRNELVS